jgi:hypothetical protein
MMERESACGVTIYRFCSTAAKWALPDATNFKWAPLMLRHGIMSQPPGFTLCSMRKKLDAKAFFSVGRLLKAVRGEFNAAAINAGFIIQRWSLQE